MDFYILYTIFEIFHNVAFIHLCSVTGENGDEGQSWGSWIWNLVPSIFPASYDTPDLTEKLQSLDFAIYMDSFSVNLKVKKKCLLN